MAEDPPSASLFLAVLDGHGEAGDKVAQVTSPPQHQMLNAILLLTPLELRQIFHTKFGIKIEICFRKG